MADINILARVDGGTTRRVDTSQNTLIVGSLKVGTSSPTELTKTILNRLITVQNGSEADTSYHTHDTQYYTEAEIASTSVTSGAAKVGVNHTASNYSPASPNVEAHLTAIDAALATSGTSSFSDTAFEIKDNGDATKKIKFQASGIATATTRTITMPDYDVDLGTLVSGPVSSTDRALALFDGPTGKLITDDGGNNNFVVSHGPARVELNTITDGKRIIVRPGDATAGTGKSNTIQGGTASDGSSQGGNVELVGGSGLTPGDVLIDGFFAVSSPQGAVTVGGVAVFLDAPGKTIGLSPTGGLVVDPSTGQLQNGTSTFDFLLDKTVASNRLLNGSADPSVTPTSANRGSVYFRRGATAGQYGIFVKTDNGNTTNWMNVGGGATTELDNLGTTAINADLLFDSDDTYAIGSATESPTTIWANLNTTYEISMRDVDAAGDVIGDIQAGSTSGFVITTVGATPTIAVKLGTKAESGTDPSADTTIFTGETVTGKSGDVILRSGNKTSNSPFSAGNVILATGDSVSPNSGGSIQLTTGTNSNQSGGIFAITGPAGNNQNTGGFQFQSGDAVANGGTGGFDLFTGQTTNGQSGAFNIFTGGASGSGISGGISLSTGSTTNPNDQGEISLQAKRTSIYGGMAITQRTFTDVGDTDAQTYDHVIIINKAVAAPTGVNLPASPDNTQVYIIKDGKGDANTNNITVDGGGNTIDGASTRVINTAYGVLRVIWSDTDAAWYTI